MQVDPKHVPFVLLLAPIAIVASLLGIRALAEGVVERHAAQAADAGWTAHTKRDGGTQTGKALAQKVMPPQASLTIHDIDSIKPYPEADDLLARAHLEDAGYVVAVDGKSRELSIDPYLQKKVKRLLRNYDPPYAAVVALDPSNGRVLAMVQSSRDPDVRGLALRSIYPAASVFKLVTASALLQHGVNPNTVTCFHGGMHRIHKKLLENSPRDHVCDDMGKALAYSANVVFAKLAHEHLSPAELRKEAFQFGFNRPLGFDEPAEASEAVIPDTPFEFATTAAGFGQVYLSPLHAALLAATVGAHGLMPVPTLFAGGPFHAPRRVISAPIAREVGSMMQLTVTEGTARRSFRERGRYVLPGIAVAGKTGSLDHRKPFHDFTWFVGYAPADHPTIAVAAVVVNTLIWRVRAPYIARETLVDYFHENPPPKTLLQARR